MIKALVSGFLLGLTLAVIIGPAFFSLIQTSIKRGFRISMFMALGILLSDITLISLSFFGISQFISERYRIVFGIIGGLILLVYGIYNFRKKTVLTEISENDNNSDNDKKYMKIKAPKPVLYIIKGYFLNIVNPFILIFWMGVMAYVVAEYHSNIEKLSVFFGTVIITVFATDLLKCYVANQIKRWLRPKILSFINHAVGVLLIIFGIYLIIKTLVVFLNTGIILP